MSLGENKGNCVIWGILSNTPLRHNFIGNKSLRLAKRAICNASFQLHWAWKDAFQWEYMKTNNEMKRSTWYMFFLKLLKSDSKLAIFCLSSICPLLTTRANFQKVNSSKKINKWIWLYCNDTSGRLVFVRFFGENWRNQKTFRK